MKMMNKTSLAVALAAAMVGYLPQQAGAVIKLVDTTSMEPAATPNGAVGGAVKLAAEQTGESTLYVSSIYGTSADVWDGDLSVHLTNMPTYYSVSGTKTLFVRTTLTNGAKFASEPSLVCANAHVSAVPANSVSGTFASAMDANSGYSGMGISGAAVIYVATASLAVESVMTALTVLVAPTIAATNKATATFNFMSGATTTSSGCLLTFIHVTANMTTAGTTTTNRVTALSVTTRQDIGMNVEVGFIQGGAITTAVFSGTIIKFVTALKVNYLTSAAVIIDVKQASKKFAAGNVNATQAVLGGMLVTGGVGASGIRLATFPFAESTAGAIMATGSITVNGNLLAGVGSIDVYDAVTCGGSKLVSQIPAAPTSGGAANSVTLTNVAIGKLTATNGVSVCASVPGTTTLNNGQITATLTGGGVTNFTPDLAANGNLVNVDINGVRLRVLNIPPPSTNPGDDQVFIRFYNTSSQEAVVRGTLYGMDGKMIGSENVVLFSPLKGNDVEALSAAALALKIGGGTTPVPAWTGRAWLLVQAEAERSSFKVQALVRSPTNTLINLSTDAQD